MQMAISKVENSAQVLSCYLKCVHDVFHIIKTVYWPNRPKTIHRQLIGTDRLPCFGLVVMSPATT
jgi:hypothetical protein